MIKKIFYTLMMLVTFISMSSCLKKKAKPSGEDSAPTEPIVPKDDGSSEEPVEQEKDGSSKESVEQKKDDSTPKPEQQSPKEEDDSPPKLEQQSPKEEGDSSPKPEPQPSKEGSDSSPKPEPQPSKEDSDSSGGGRDGDASSPFAASESDKDLRRKFDEKLKPENQKPCVVLSTDEPKKRNFIEYIIHNPVINYEGNKVAIKSSEVPIHSLKMYGNKMGEINYIYFSSGYSTANHPVLGTIDAWRNNKLPNFEDQYMSSLEGLYRCLEGIANSNYRLRVGDVPKEYKDELMFARINGYGLIQQTSHYISKLYKMGVKIYIPRNLSLTSKENISDSAEQVYFPHIIAFSSRNHFYVIQIAGLRSEWRD